MKINSKEYQTNSEGSIKAICYCVNCCIQRNERNSKMTGWVKFYLITPEETSEGFRYFRPICKGTNLTMFFTQNNKKISDNFFNLKF
jgi:hypothetical protein